MNRPHIVVIGGGPIGLATAIAIAASREIRADVTVIERAQQMPSVEKSDDRFDHRVYALSLASIAFLERIDVWSRIAMSASTVPIDRMRVFSDTDADVMPEIGFGLGAPLAHIVEHRALMAALLSRADESVARGELKMRNGVTVQAMHLSTQSNVRTLTLDDGSTLDADLVIAADGRASPTRAMAGIDVVTKDYGIDGVIANFAIEKPHGNIAYQWFSPEGVLAYLPLPHNQISIVWSVAHDKAIALRALDDAAFANAVADAGHRTLGVLTLTSAREAISLMRQRSLDWVAPAFALVGDAAHAVHPLAGQGANLGYGDAAALVETLAARSRLQRVGDVALLRRYARSRAEATALMAETTDRLQSLYQSNSAVSKWVRHTGFEWFDRLSLVKRFATEMAMRS